MMKRSVIALVAAMILYTPLYVLSQDKAHQEMKTYRSVTDKKNGCRCAPKTYRDSCRCGGSGCSCPK